LRNRKRWCSNVGAGDAEVPELIDLEALGQSLLIIPMPLQGLCDRQPQRVPIAISKLLGGLEGLRCDLQCRDYWAAQVASSEVCRIDRGFLIDPPSVGFVDGCFARGRAT
jgi:hypothetical protein